MILVTGATGTVGSSLVAALRAAGHEVKALVQSFAAVPSSWENKVPVVVADLGDPSSLQAAMTGVDAVYLLVPADPMMARYERNVIDAAKDAAGRPRVVLHAAAGFDHKPNAVRFLNAHAQGFAELRASGLPWTVLAPNGFMQNIFGMAAMVADGVLALPAGDAAVSYVDAVDVATAAATVLTTDGHDDAVYTLTGPDAVTHALIAQRLGHVLGYPVRYQPIGEEQARTGTSAGGGSAAWLRDGMIELFGVYRSGAASAVTGDLPRLVGRPARALDSFLATHAAALMRAARTT